jgi:hypothetical protein
MQPLQAVKPRPLSETTGHGDSAEFFDADQRVRDHPAEEVMEVKRKVLLDFINIGGRTPNWTLPVGTNVAMIIFSRTSCGIGIPIPNFCDLTFCQNYTQMELLSSCAAVVIQYNDNQQAAPLLHVCDAQTVQTPNCAALLCFTCVTNISERCFSAEEHRLHKSAENLRS